MNQRIAIMLSSTQYAIWLRHVLQTIGFKHAEILRTNPDAMTKGIEVVITENQHPFAKNAMQIPTVKVILLSNSLTELQEKHGADIILNRPKGIRDAHNLTQAIMQLKKRTADANHYAAISAARILDAELATLTASAFGQH